MMEQAKDSPKQVPRALDSLLYIVVGEQEMKE